MSIGERPSRWPLCALCADDGSGWDLARDWAATQHVGGGHIQVYGADDVVRIARHVAGATTYRDNAALAVLKVLDAAGALRPAD